MEKEAKAVIERRVFEMPEKGQYVLEMRDSLTAMYDIVGIKPDGSETILGIYSNRLYADDDFYCAVNTYAEYLTDEYERS